MELVWKCAVLGVAVSLLGLLLRRSGEEKTLLLGMAASVTICLACLRSLEDAEALEGDVGELAGEAGKESRIALIRQGTEEYIWDAARSLGIGRLGIRLTFDERGEIPVPRTISLSGSWTEEQQSRLSLLLEGELGIPPERQNWSLDDAG